MSESLIRLDRLSVRGKEGELELPPLARLDALLKIRRDELR